MRMQLQTGRLKQGGVGRIADERVLEAVRMMRRRPTTLDEPRAAQLIEHRRQLRLRVSRDRADDLAREVAALAITLHTSLIKSAVRDVLHR